MRQLLGWSFRHMNQPRLIDRFQGEEGKSLLIECLRRQFLIKDDFTVASFLAEHCELRELSAGDVLIRQGDSDTDVYFILSGRLRILVDQREVAIRVAGQHVGEMALMDPSLARSATNVAAEPTLVAKVSESVLAPIADSAPRIWRAMGGELSRRLNQQGAFLRPKNRIPHLLIRANRETKDVAEALALSVHPQVATTKVICREVFGSEAFPIEDLEAQLRVADFAALISPHDERVRSRSEGSNSLRDNLVFEVGLLMGALTRHRAFLVVPECFSPGIPTDLLGVTPLLYRPATMPLTKAILSTAVELQNIIQSMGPR
ncbi:MAG: hypothetical protein RLZZ399_2877 [Verrucomicrobiota bacterium]